MPDLLRLLEIGRRALLAHQSVMSTTGQNIANVNTIGYSRQRVDLAAGRPTVTPNGIFGSGVQIANLRRIRDRFIDQQLINERGSFGKFEFKSDSLDFIEQIFNEPTDFGLNRMMEDFWNSWHDLSNNPESNAARTVVQGAAITLASGFNRVHRQLSNYVNEINKELQFKVDDVNRLAGEIANLNDKISSFEAKGNEASDFRDQRDLLIDQLSKLVNIQTHENQSGVVNVSLGNRFLIVDTQVEELSLSPTSTGDLGPQVIWARDGDLVNITQGTLKGILDIRDINISDYFDQLGELARTLTEQVNAIHRNGYNLTGQTNIKFFNDNIKGAEDFAVSTEIRNDAKLIATSAAQGTPGDNSIALSIAELQDSLVMANGTSTFGDFYNSLISSLGGQSQEASFLKNSFNLTVEKLENTRESVSGVSLDEEMINMIEAQTAFTAASRFISTVDEMTQTVLNMT